MLGIALCRQDRHLFNTVAENLGENIKPFSDSIDQFKGRMDNRVTQLLNLTLKAAIAANEVQMVDVVFWFANETNYVLTVDEQTVWYALQ